MNKKKPIPPLIKHRDHQVEIQQSTAHNFYKYYCKDCSVFVAWLSKQEVRTGQEKGIITT